MSPADSTDAPRGVYVQKPKADIYTVLLAIALVAILIACVILYLEMSAYNFDIRATEGRFRAAIEVPADDARYALAPREVAPAAFAPLMLSDRRMRSA